MINRIMDWIAAWWRIDRVRISPTVGRLLSLQVGDPFIFDSEKFLVTDREVKQFETRYEIVLRLGWSGDHISIHASQNGLDFNMTATIHRQGIANPIFDDDIAITSKREIPA